MNLRQPHSFLPACPWRPLALSFVLMLCAAVGGCGRVGFELLPAPNVESGGDDGGRGSDAGDAGEPDAGDGGSDAGDSGVGPGDEGGAGDAAAGDGGGADGSDAGGCVVRGSEDDTCDGVDDDCDGEVDEDYTSRTTACGRGPCLAEGETSCVDGVEQDSCTPGEGAADDASCDNVDNDCDGEVDEDYVVVATSCGAGACAASGSLSCVGGVEQDSCSAGAPAADDSVCNGVDDDCDGEVDEDYVITSTSCGAGGCGGTGQLLCIDGGTVDNCVPGQPATSDPTCDGVDDDCDGQTDEDYVSLNTSCGTGACAATGTTSCVGGAVQNSCSAGAPLAGDDPTCDGVDDDCDGQTDEDYNAPQTSCGTGACAASGSLICVSGQTSDTCTPGSPSPDDNTGVLGVDDDCDGEVDENVVCNDPDLVLTAGAHDDIQFSPECTRITARVWGAGGAAGGKVGKDGGNGGGGGYAQVTFAVSQSSVVDVLVGEGGVCRSGGSDYGYSTYYGGSGADGSVLLGAGGNGAAGGDRSVAGGGSGADPSGGGRGGNGHYGGGGGGTAGTLVGSAGDGGGGGAASVVLLDASPLAVAGGGGGGGGAASQILIFTAGGGDGGGGCSGAGSIDDSGGGGGGGGGLCIGDSVQAPTGRDPHDPDNLLSGQARGGASSCGGGGDGYAVLSFER